MAHPVARPCTAAPNGQPAPSGAGCPAGGSPQAHARARSGPAVGVQHRIGRPGDHRRGAVDGQHDRDAAGLEPSTRRRLAALRWRAARARRRAGTDPSPSESLSATPIGSFGLTQAFGSQTDPGTALPYFRTDSADWWVSDVHSSLYNQHARCWPGSCPFNTAVSENLYQAGYVYSYAVVIDYNRFPVRAARVARSSST